NQNLAPEGSNGEETKSVKKSAGAPGNLAIIATFRANRRGGFHIRPGSLAVEQDFCGRAMLAPAVRL
ncbi:MAG: hypothetical protein MSS49_01775, partial [Subdoligranulum variabile]|nr:hypothetical protein [Subdoligranulum variabile]